MAGDKLAYCINCACKNKFSIKASRKAITVKGIEISYIERSAHCSTCGEEIYVPEVNDENVISREEAYRHSAQLITESEINEILEKYNIGAGPLAKIMGLGEVTINRYVGGQTPSKENSDLLLEVHSSHRKLEEYLENNKEKISQVAYKKCREALDKIREINGADKIDVVTRYLLSKSEDITHMALQKLLYYTQSFFYAFYGEEIFTTPCEAWLHGPVFPDVYNKYKDYSNLSISKPTLIFDVNSTELTEKEMSFLDAIVSVFGQYSASTLRNFTHKEKPWKEARGTLEENDRCSNELSRGSIHDYFENAVKLYNMTKPEDMMYYCEQMLLALKEKNI